MKIYQVGENVMKIILIRHAKVQIDNPTIASFEMNSFIEAYNTASIQPFDISNRLKSLIDSVDSVFTSNLSRTKESAKYLGIEIDKSSDIFNEAGLPYANWTFFKLPATLWALLFRMMWLFGYANNSESYKEAKIRATIAADSLLECTQNNKTVLFIGHGVMNKLISKELKCRGVFLIEKSGNENLGYSIFNADNIKEKNNV